MADSVIHPIGGTARAFLRQICMTMGTRKLCGEQEQLLAAECSDAGYLDAPTVDPSVVVITEKGIAYLDRLARAE